MAWKGGVHMLRMIPTTSVKGVTRIICPACGERAKRIGLLPGSRVEGLTFRCKRCGRFWEVISEPAETAK